MAVKQIDIIFGNGQDGEALDLARKLLKWKDTDKVVLRGDASDLIMRGD